MRQPIVRIATLLAVLCLIAMPSPNGVTAQQVSLADQLLELADEWAEPRSERRIPDVSLATAEAEAEVARSVLDRLGQIDRRALGHQEQLTWSVLHWQAAAAVDGLGLYWYTSPLMPAITPMRTALAIASAATFETAEDADRYMQFLDKCVDTLQAVLAKARGRAARQIVIPDEQIDRVLPFWRAFAASGVANPLFIEAGRYGDLEAEAAAGFSRRLRRKFDRQLTRAAERIVAYVDTSLRERAPNTPGMGQYPGGKRAYRLATRLMTTLEISPEEVHEIGLAGVADINRQMAEVREQLGFTGTKAQFHEQLRRDPRFYVDTPEQFGAALMAYDAKIRPHLFDYFLREPEAPYAVRRVDPALEASLTYGFYNPPTDSDPNGYYNYNGSKLSERSLLSGVGLAYHELVPGHHFQINLARENDELPEFRKNAYFSGYGEGWGEYSSSVVAREMGLYEDPYDLYGRLVFDMFFAVRLVVDTGMNFYGWSRPKAMLYMREHTMESDLQIDSETIRYSMRSPAQALAYRMGRETWVRLRRAAEDELGSTFDVREFHDSVLSIGSVPLIVLEDHVRWWIAQARR